MTKVKYETEVVKLGPMAGQFIDDGILVFFGMDVPDELAEFAILHEHTSLNGPVEVGDIIYFDDRSMPILSIGPVANKNLANLGHFVVKFNSRTDPDMPGDISVDESMPVPTIEPGMVVKIVSEES